MIYFVETETETVEVLLAISEVMQVTSKNTVNSVISGHHRGNDFCPLIGDVRLLESLAFLTFCCLGRGSLKVLELISSV